MKGVGKFESVVCGTGTIVWGITAVDAALRRPLLIVNTFGRTSLIVLFCLVVVALNNAFRHRQN